MKWHSWLLVLACGLGLLYYTVRESRSLSAAIASEVARGPGTVLDLPELLAIDWDALHLFGPYTSLAAVEGRLGAPLSSGTRIESADGVVLVVFTKSGRVVHAFDHPREEGDFTGGAGGLGDDGRTFTRAEARFVVKRAAGWRSLVPLTR